jgi:hypothetical protein
MTVDVIDGMKGERIMRTILRNAVLATGALVLCAAGTARAGETPILHGFVPFQFVVDGRTFQPGTYTIEQDDESPALLLIRSDSGNHSARFVSTIPDEGRDPAGSHPALTFKRYEGQFRLEGLWRGNGDGFDVVTR